MKKKENSIKKLFNLDKDVVNRIVEIANMLKIQQNEVIEMLVKNWDEQVNPLHLVRNIRNQKLQLKEKLNELEKEEEQALLNAEKIEEWRELKKVRKPLIIKNLVRMMLEQRYEDAEIIAKTQAIQIGVPAINLINEAIEIVKKGV